MRSRSQNPERSAVPRALHAIVCCLIGITCGAPASGSQDRQPDAQLFIQVRGLSEQLETAPARAAREILSELGLFERTAESWNTLSAALGLTGDEAVRALLAGRFTLLANGVNTDNHAWACVMTIDPAVGARIPKALKAAPRGTLDGRTVYAIEDGRLSVMPIGNGGRVLALASRGGDSLLNACAMIASSWEHDRYGYAARGNAFDQAQPGAVVIYRPSAGSLISGTITPMTNGWDFAFVASGGALGTPDAETPAETAVIDRDWYTNISADAAVAYAGPLRADEKPADDASVWRLDDLPTLAAAFLPYAPPPAFMAGEADFAMLINRGGGNGSMWFRVLDAARAAKLGDAHVCDLIGNLPAAGLVSGDSPECTGIFPDAGRRLAIPVATASTGERVGLAWGTRRFAAMGDATARRRPDARISDTWWTMQSIGSRKGAVPSEAPRFQPAGNGPYMRFTIRPGKLLSSIPLTGGQPGLPAVGPIASVGRVSLLDCELFRDATGGTSGLARLRFGPPDPDSDD